jgi:hypothetical protein
MYTNGTLLTRKLASELHDAGLDEIRIDIGATSYRLDRVRLATEFIDQVTVEIPAVPEDLDLLASKLANLSDAGVKSLNLHQLRLTPHNLANLVQRTYTFLHGDHVTVLESELAALELIARSLESGLGPPINYCSSIYKSRFQRAAARRRSATLIMREREAVTAAGFIRTMSDLPAGRGLRLDYHEPRIVPGVSYHHPFREVPLTKSRRIAVERSPAGPALELSQEEGDLFLRFLLQGGSLPDDTLTAPLRRALEFETLESGLQEYF